MTDGKSIRACYGEASDRPECRACGIRECCRDFAASEKALAVNRSRIVGIPERIPDAAPAEVPPPAAPKYSEEDLRRVIAFFLTMTGEEFAVIQLRITRPELTSQDIAAKLGIARRAVYDIFRRECELVPELTKLLYRRKR